MCFAQRSTPPHSAAITRSAGAAAISVLTDGPDFGGSLDDLAAVRAAVDSPLLRKDFTIDPVQIAEARVAGADWVLLIVAILDARRARRAASQGRPQRRACIVRGPRRRGGARRAAAGATCVGINNRDLSTLTHRPRDFRAVRACDCRTASCASPNQACARPEDVTRLVSEGADAVLVGEALMRAAVPSCECARRWSRPGERRRRVVIVKVCGVRTPGIAEVADRCRRRLDRPDARARRARGGLTMPLPLRSCRGRRSGRPRRRLRRAHCRGLRRCRIAISPRCRAGPWPLRSEPGRPPARFQSSLSSTWRAERERARSTGRPTSLVMLDGRPDPGRAPRVAPATAYPSSGRPMSPVIARSCSPAVSGADDVGAAIATVRPAGVDAFEPPGTRPRREGPDARARLRSAPLVAAAQPRGRRDEQPRRAVSTATAARTSRRRSCPRSRSSRPRSTRAFADRVFIAELDRRLADSQAGLPLDACTPAEERMRRRTGLAQARGPVAHRGAQAQQRPRPGAARQTHGQAPDHRGDRRGPARCRHRHGVRGARPRMPRLHGSRGHAPAGAERLQDAAARRRGRPRGQRHRRRSKTRPTRRSATGSPTFASPTTSSAARSGRTRIRHSCAGCSASSATRHARRCCTGAAACPTSVVACVGGGSNAIGIFAAVPRR